LYGDFNRDGFRDLVMLHRGWLQTQEENAANTIQLRASDIPGGGKYNDSNSVTPGTRTSPDFQNMFFSMSKRRWGPNGPSWVSPTGFNSGYPGRGRSYRWGWESSDGVAAEAFAWDKPSAEWRHHVGDVNGDGLDDIVSTYRGASGEKLDLTLGNIRGILNV